MKDVIPEPDGGQPGDTELVDEGRIPPTRVHFGFCVPDDDEAASPEDFSNSSAV